MRRWGIVGLVVAMALGGQPAAAGAAEPLPPFAFRLEASNGFAVRAFFGVDPTGRGGIDLFVLKRGQGVMYAAPAKVDETSVSADLGPLGSIDVHFVPSGGTVRSGERCASEPFDLEAGAYEGSIVLHGEEEYTQAEASRAPGDFRFLEQLVCGESGSSEGVGGRSPGALLTVHRKVGASRLRFSVRKNSPTRVARFEAEITERRGPLTVSRWLASVAPPSAFSYDFAAKAARVAPLPPFSGSLAYDGSRGRYRRVHGRPAIDFPGRSNVRLAGPRTAAGMVRAVLNPGHPFRVLP